MTGILETLQEPAIKIALAILLGGLIGLEREIHGKAAGLRTNILICAGSAAMMIVSAAFADSGRYGSPDPARIAAQVVTGIGFIGAGTIIQSRGSVTGLTSAATIFVVAGVGLAVGAGLYPLAILVTLFMLFVLLILGRIESAVFRSRQRGCRIALVAQSADVVEAILGVFEESGVTPTGTRTVRSDRGIELEFGVTCGPAALNRLQASLAKIGGLLEINVETEAFDK